MAKKTATTNTAPTPAATMHRRSHNTIGYGSIGQLQNNSCTNVPNTQGIFLVLKTNTNPPVFINPGTGGFYKGINPNVPISVLQNKWVPDSNVLYIGESKNLKRRILNFVRCGNGCNTIDACGGRYIWQLQDNKLLHICWIPLPNGYSPKALRDWLLQDFEKSYEGALPFANIHH